MLVFTFEFYISECIPGYHGRQGTDTCLYPTYREKCQGICDCGNDRCNVSTGCRASSSLQQVSTANYNKIVIVKHLVSIE